MEGGVSFLLLLSIDSNRRPSNFAIKRWWYRLVSLSSVNTLFHTFHLSLFIRLFEFPSKKISSVLQGSISLSFVTKRIMRQASTIICWESNRGKSWDGKRHISSSSFDRALFVNILFHVFHLFIRLFESLSEKISYFSKNQFFFRRRESRDDERQWLSIERAIEAKVGIEGDVSFLFLLSIDSNRRPSNFTIKHWWYRLVSLSSLIHTCSTLFIFLFLSDYSNFRIKKLVRFSKDRFLFLSRWRESWDDKHQRSSVERAIEAKVGMEGGISLLLSIESHLLTSCSMLFIFLSDYSNLRVKKLASSLRIFLSSDDEENHETTSVNDHPSREQ